MFEHIFRIVIAKISILTLNRINATEPNSVLKIKFIIFNEVNATDPFLLYLRNISLHVAITERTTF